jgi:antitoxin HigA-1
MLLEEFLKPMELSQRELATAIGVSYQRINEIVNGRRGISPGTAVRLAHFFEMSSGFWLNLQTRWDLYHAERTEAPILRQIRKYRATRGSSSN